MSISCVHSLERLVDGIAKIFNHNFKVDIILLELALDEAQVLLTEEKYSEKLEISEKYLT